MLERVQGLVHFEGEEKTTYSLTANAGQINIRAEKVPVPL